jgi:ribosomal protein L11 methylase PrmA
LRHHDDPSIAAVSGRCPPTGVNVEVAEAGSFRDPSGRVYEIDGEILRSVAPCAAADYDFVSARGVLDSLSERGWLVGSTEVEKTRIGAAGAAAHRVIRHPRLPFVSYPYEWSFPLLKAAALLHLDIQIEVLERDIALSDASAYNIQFNGVRPVFIDVLSFRQYRDGEFWTGHRQFCEQFLNPLLLRSLFGITHNAWFRGGLEGIGASDLARLLPWWRRWSWRILAHVVLPARFQRRAIEKDSDLEALGRIKRRPLPEGGYLTLLLQLRRWIAKLSPCDTGRSVWGDYQEAHSYGSDEEQAKRRFVASFCEAVRPGLLWDLGCNTGEYSEVALSAGAGHVIGFDFDQQALERAYARAAHKNLPFLPLFQDSANPSPAQGWRSVERKGLSDRASADAVLALAFEHHLAIGRNVPLDGVLAWLVSLAPRGVIEFVQKGDPTVRRMLALREDVFHDYSEGHFVAALGQRARIIRSEVVSAAGRTLYWFDRS